MADNFIVSARKYRPARFDEMLGQESISKTLSNSILQGKTAHAYLFCGPRGVGKTSAARIFAKTVNCTQPTPEGEACNECESCRAINEQRSFNLFELDAASNNSADDIRKINEDVYIPPQYGKYKVYIIDEVHMLSSSAFNAFLKTLEEPPEYVIFVLATTEKNKVLPTILSRCQVFDFKPIPPQTISQQLHRVAECEGLSYESRALDLIARIADGGMRDALSIFDRIVSASNGNITYERTLNGLNILDDEYYFSLTNFLLAGNYKQTLLLFDELMVKGVNGRTIVLGLADFLRNLLMAHAPETHPLFKYTGGDADRFGQLALRSNPLLLYKAIDKLMNCDRNYRSSNSKRLLVELTLINIAEMSGAFTDHPPLSPSPSKENCVPNNEATTTGTPLAGKPAGQNNTSDREIAGDQEAERAVPSSSRTYSQGKSTAPSPLHQGQESTPVQSSNSSPIQESGAQALQGTDQRTSFSHPITPSTSSSTKSSQQTPPSPLSSLGRSARGGMKRIRTVAAQKDEDNNTQTLSAPEADAPHAPLTEEKLSIEWNRYAEEHLVTEIYLRQTMQSNLPQITSPDSFRITVLNELQKSELEATEVPLIQYLRNQLDNHYIEMSIEVDATPRSRKPVTTDEKMQYLIDLNPHVADFIDGLSLKPL